MKIKIVSDQISTEEIRELAQEFYVNMIKGVVDIEKEVIALGGEYHMDANVFLLEKGSKQENVWGFNIHLHKQKDSEEWIEYTSLINIRPNQGNRSMEIQDEDIRQKIKEILNKLIK